MHTQGNTAISPCKNTERCMAISMTFKYLFSWEKGEIKVFHAFFLYEHVLMIHYNYIFDFDIVPCFLLGFLPRTFEHGPQGKMRSWHKENKYIDSKLHYQVHQHDYYAVLEYCQYLLFFFFLIYVCVSPFTRWLHKFLFCKMQGFTAANTQLWSIPGRFRL